MKRMTKEKKIAQEKQALRQIVASVFQGACDENILWSEDCAGPIWPGMLARIIKAIRAIFDPEEEKKYMWEIHNIDEYESIEKAVDFLHENGFRAFDL